MWEHTAPGACVQTHCIVLDFRELVPFPLTPRAVPTFALTRSAPHTSASSFPYALTRNTKPPSSYPLRSPSLDLLSPPPLMAVRPTLARFPVDADAQESCGLPWGAAVTPFSPSDERGAPPVAGSGGHLLPRCDHCWAYFNTYCDLEQWAWTCALCGTLNGLTSDALRRFSRPDDCPELSSSFVDLDLPGLLASISRSFVIFLPSFWVIFLI